MNKFAFKTEFHQCKYSDEAYAEYIAFFLLKAKDKLISLSQPYKEVTVAWTWEEPQIRMNVQYYLEKIVL